MNRSILEAHLYAKARLPLGEAEGLPPWCYTSPEFYGAEVERIFRTTWNFVGHESELANPGDYKTIDVLGDSIIVLRDRAGLLRAFANSCRHRGTRLLSGDGRCRLITCPYHSWAFNLSGELVRAPGMEEAQGFDPSEHGLIPVRLETWTGLMFVTFDRESIALRHHLGNAVDTFAPYRFDDMVCTRRREFDLGCNWKIYIENAMEDYHTATVHRVSIGTQVCEREEASGEWDALYLPAATTSAVLPGEKTTFPTIATLTGRSAGGTYFSLIYPNLFFAATQDCMWWLHAAPRGPGRVLVTHGTCFPRATVARADFKEEVEKYYRRWDKSLPEDNEISELQQAGLQSSLSRPGRLSPHEPVVHAIEQWVLSRVLNGSETLQRSA